MGLESSLKLAASLRVSVGAGPPSWRFPLLVVPGVLALGNPQAEPPTPPTLISAHGECLLK